MSLSYIETAIAQLRQGKMIILVDDENRENEGDLVVAAEYVTPEVINFMTQYGRGLVCFPMAAECFDRLEIPMMTKNNGSKNKTAFGVSIGAAEGITTGISAADRAHTIKVAASPNSTAKDIVMPGHVFPLRACKGGVLERGGHTEGSVDLTRLAGLYPAAVICEIMNSDGSMARLPDLTVFAKQHHLPIVSMRDLVTYRLRNEKLLEAVSSSYLPLHEVGKFGIHTFRSMINNSEHIALVRQPLDLTHPVLVRIHSECLTGDVFGSARCDCGRQLDHAMAQIAGKGGVLLYLRQEGRGIGLSNKIKAYDLQDQGYDTVEANHQLGFSADERDYGVAAQMLRALGIERVRLLTNNPKKLSGLQDYGLNVIERVPLETVPTKDNIRYLKAKREKLGHWLNFQESEL